VAALALASFLAGACSEGLEEAALAVVAAVAGSEVVVVDAEDLEADLAVGPVADVAVVVVAVVAYLAALLDLASQKVVSPSPAEEWVDQLVLGQSSALPIAVVFVVAFGFAAAVVEAVHDVAAVPVVDAVHVAAAAQGVQEDLACP
jgi:hypothetical protein